MALSSFLNVNGYDFPCPRVGFSYTLSTAVSSGRNANNAVVGQVVGREIVKLDNMQWAYLPADTWQMMLKAIEPFFVNVTIEDYRTGKPMTVVMYPGDRKATPLFVDKNSHKIIRYENCSFNLVDCGLE